MALTREFKQTIQERVHSDPKFARALLNEAIELFLTGDPDSAKVILHDLVNATVGFNSLSEQLSKSDKSLHRMLSDKGNPTMTNLSAIFSAIQKALSVSFNIRAIKV